MKRDAGTVKETMRKTMLTIAEIVRDDILELLFPTRCLGCNLRGTWFCDLCHATTQLRRTAPYCLLCGRLNTQPGKLCPADRRRVGLTGLVAYGTFHAKPLARAVYAIKYQSAWAALPHLATAFLERNRFILQQSWSAVVPVPLAPARAHERGYNQSALFARGLADRLETPLLTSLVRSRETPSQVGLSRPERLQNVAGAFAWTGAPLRGTVLLVDDVVTTGATLKAASRALRQAGAQDIWGGTIAVEE